MNNISQIMNKKWVLFIYAYTIIAFVLMNSGMTSLRIVNMAVFIFVALFLSPIDITIEMSIVCPICQFARIPSGFTVFPFLTLIAVAKMLLKNTFMEKRFVLSYGLLFILSIFASLAEYGGVLPIIPFFLNILFVYLMIKKCRTTEEAEEVFLWCAICFAVSVAIECVGSQLLPNVANFLSSSTGRKSLYTTRNYGFSSIWDFGQNIVIAVGAMFTVWRKKRVSFIFFIVASVFFLYYLMTTMLYTAFAGIAVLIILMPFSMMRFESRSDYLKIVAFFFFVALLGFLAYTFLLLPMIANRGEFSDNGRFDIWNYYIQQFLNSPRIMFFGVGADSIMSYANARGILSTHNVIIEKFMEFGLLGVAVLISVLKAIYYGCEKKLYNNPNPILLLSLLAMGCFQGLSGNDALFLLLVLAYKPIENHDLEVTQ